jgi:hypothetical protein
LPAKASSLPKQLSRRKPEQLLERRNERRRRVIPHASAALVTLSPASSKLSDDNSRMR